MRVKTNRLLLSETSVFSLINNGNKIDLSFVQSPIALSTIQTELDLIAGRNYPLVNRVLQAVQDGSIVLTCTENKSTSLVYVYGGNGEKTSITKVFVNLSRFSKIEKVVTQTGEIQNQIRIQGGYEVLYDLLLGAYVGLHCKRVYEANPTATKLLRDIYTDLIAQCMSRGKFGHPIDGEKFRFFVNYFFYNGDISAHDLAQNTKFPFDKAASLVSLYPDFFSQKPLTLEELMDVIVQEFPSLSRNNLNAKSFLLSSVSTLGDNAVYLLDNHAYFLSVVIHKARKSKIFPGYLLKTIESDSTRLQSAIYQSFL